MGMPIDGLTGVGTYEEIKSTGTGALLVASAAGGGAAQSPSNATSSAYETSRVIKASAGTLYGFTVHNSLASTQFIQLHDASSLPADAAVPVVVISAPANTTVSWSADPFGRRFTTGIVLTNSTTGPTKTIGAANLWIDAQFI